MHSQLLIIILIARIIIVYNQYSHSDCSGWLSSCTINNSTTGCETTYSNVSYTQSINQCYSCTNTWMPTCELHSSNTYFVDKTCLRIIIACKLQQLFK
ncbi:unnamed protein product [Paramecium sonneborni]|uniref:Secreted protein n=1 Tax=Paramecium sonneborni TaxID=65129 RepID=A0A8S1RM55_9CILI|nr:unnamed protein product [Paramecium sonneborni]